MTEQTKYDHIFRLNRAVAGLLTAAAACRDVNTEAAQMGYATGGTNALVDADFTGCGAPCLAGDYNTILATMSALETACSASGPNNGPSIWQILRILST